MQTNGAEPVEHEPERFLRAFRKGRWRSGERLPPERALAQEFGIGRAAVRRALAALEREGRIRRRVGQGTFVTVPPEEEVTAILRLSPPPGPADILELRLMIEPQIAAAAALRASDPAIARLREIAAHGAEAPDWQEWEATDSHFHTSLAEATRNPLLTGVLETLNVIRRRPEWAQLRSTTLTRREQAAYTDQHVALVDAVARRDPKGAADAMRGHLAAVRNTMFGGDRSLAALVPVGDKE